MPLSRSLLLIYVAGFLRSLGVGLLGVVLAVYLSRVGIGAASIGLVIGIGLLGACAATAMVTWAGRRIGYRISLVALALLAALGGLGLVALPAFPLLLLLVFVGMVNGMERTGVRPSRLSRLLFRDSSRTEAEPGGCPGTTFCSTAEER